MGIVNVWWQVIGWICIWLFAKILVLVTMVFENKDTQTNYIHHMHVSLLLYWHLFSEDCIIHHLYFAAIWCRLFIACMWVICLYIVFFQKRQNSQDIPCYWLHYWNSSYSHQIESGTYFWKVAASKLQSRSWELPVGLLLKEYSSLFTQCFTE